MSFLNRWFAKEEAYRFEATPYELRTNAIPVSDLTPSLGPIGTKVWCKSEGEYGITAEGIFPKVVIAYRHSPYLRINFHVHVSLTRFDVGSFEAAIVGGGRLSLNLVPREGMTASLIREYAAVIDELDGEIKRKMIEIRPYLRADVSANGFVVEPRVLSVRSA